MVTAVRQMVRCTRRFVTHFVTPALSLQQVNKSKKPGGLGTWVSGLVLTWAKTTVDVEDLAEIAE